MLTLGEIHARGAKIAYSHVLFANVRAKHPKYYPRVLEERSKVGVKAAKTAQTMEAVDARWVK